MKRVLLIAFHYPPVSVSSGLQRTLSFSRYLPENGWLPAVLTAHPRSYLRTSDDQLGDVPSEVRVKRAFAIDSSRHLAFRGRYFGLLALPDQWVSWWLGAVVSGLGMIREFRPDVIWSTYPIATSHLIGLSLARLTGLPWVADFRDLMLEDDYPTEAKKRWLHRFIESHAMARCQRAVFVTPGALRQYRSRYQSVEAERFAVIPNGFDDEIVANLPEPAPVEEDALTFVHAGIIYPDIRDPRFFFEAIARLRDKSAPGIAKMRVKLRGTSHDEAIGALVQEFSLQDVVSILPPVTYREALAEMRDSDALLVFQGSDCNDQIPAKVYEYLALERPIFALTDRAGDTAAFLAEVGVGTIAPLDDADRIEAELAGFLTMLEEGRAPVAPSAEIARHSRRARSAELAGVLDEVSATSGK